MFVEPLRLDIQIINISEEELHLLIYIVFRSHVRLTISDEAGDWYEFPGCYIKQTIAPPQSMDDYVKLTPGQFIGQCNFTDNFVVITNAGRYTISATYNDAGFSSDAERLGIAAWSGHVQSAPIDVEIVDTGDARFAGKSKIEIALDWCERQ